MTLQGFNNSFPVGTLTFLGFVRVLVILSTSVSSEILEIADAFRPTFSQEK